MNKPLFCMLTLAVAPLAGADEVGNWYITPQAGYLWTDDDRAADDDWLYGLSFGKHISKRWSLELNLNESKPDLPGGDLRFDAASFDLLHFFNREAAVSPYLTLGAGWLSTEVDPGAAADDFLTQAGLGLIWRVTDRFGLRPEVKARWDDTGTTGHQTDYLAQIGFQFSFGAPKAMPVAPEPPPPPPPAPAEAQAAPSPPQAEPAPLPDSDRDGVVDPQDQCPGTPAGVAVDAMGCERKGSITLEGVTFQLNSAEITVDSRPALDRVAADLRKYPRLKIELQGHTDSSGADKYNLNLSQRRAETVARYLMDAGIPASQVRAKGYGEGEPIADNKTESGRAQNRRVVMKVLENPGDVEVQGEGSL